MKTKTLFVILSALIIFPSTGVSESVSPTLAERLGYAADSKLLILHNDDVGMSNSVNRASIQALESGAVNSSSIMVPPPWFSNFAEYAAAHPEYDWGIHLTLTSEWPDFRWRPVLPVDQVSSLVGEDGFLHPGIPDMSQVVPGEAESELKAQIQWALDRDIQLTHLDTHMGTLLTSPGLFEVYLKLGQAFNLPVLLPRNWVPPDLMKRIEQNEWASKVMIDQAVSMSDTVAPEDWMSAYEEMIASLQPGVTELIVHVGFDNEELQAIGSGIEPWGSAWRQREFDAVTSEVFQRLLAEKGVQLITWGDVQKSMQR